MAEILINGKPYEHHFVRGTVVGASKQLETKVHGSGGGGGMYQGTGYTAPVNISSTTTTHDMVHLQTGEGKEHALRLQNWDLAVRETHLLSAIWLIKAGKSNGPYVAIHNHTLNQTDYDEKQLDKMHRTLWILLASLAILIIPLPFIGMGMRFMLMIAGIAYWWYLGIKGRKELIASGKLLSMAGI